MQYLDPIALVGLTVAGLFAGFVNTVAGGGSFLTIPVLMQIGLPVEIANATNRVAVLAQSSSGAAAFYREGKLDRSAVLDVVPATVVGAIIGTLAASYAPREILKPILLLTMVVMALLMVFRPNAIVPSDEKPLRVSERKHSML